MQSKPFEIRGFAIVEGAMTAERLLAAEAELAARPLDSAGDRDLLLHPWCREAARELRSHRRIASLVPEDAVAVQCTLFEKSAERNWLVPWHRDVHIPVREEVDNPALTGWSRKEGAPYVKPPIDVLLRLVAVRVHLDDCGPANGPLRVLPGSHMPQCLGEEPTAVASRSHLCVARRGDALVMKPLLLHASSKAAEPNRRRVLHFLFGPRSLPFGLSWRVAV